MKSRQAVFCFHFIANKCSEISVNNFSSNFLRFGTTYLCVLKLNGRKNICHNGRMFARASFRVRILPALATTYLYFFFCLIFEHFNKSEWRNSQKQAQKRYYGYWRMFICRCQCCIAVGKCRTAAGLVLVSPLYTLKFIYIRCVNPDREKIVTYVNIFA